jgi:hypothetical protein
MKIPGNKEKREKRMYECKKGVKKRKREKKKERRKKFSADR